MRNYTRHQLKQNAFAETTAETISWAVEHRSKLIAAAIVVALVAAARSGHLGVRELSQPAGQRRAGRGPAEVQRSHPSRRRARQSGSVELCVRRERAKAANADFTRIADKYSFTRNGRIARYFAGITLHDLGDNAGAEKQLQEVAGSRDKEVASLAKLALAVDRSGRGQDATGDRTLQEPDRESDDFGGATTAQFELATLYEANHQPLEARKLYEQMQKADPTGQVGQMAAQKLQTLRPPQP